MKKITLIAFVLIANLLLPTFCSAQLLPTVTTDSIKSITATTGILNGNLTDDGNDPNTQNGFCFSTAANPTLANNIRYCNYGIGTFSITVSRLIPQTIYYVRAFATNVKGTTYGSQKQFTTVNATMPTVTTDSISIITSTTAIGYGNITNDGNDPKTASGFCFDISPNPTIANKTVYSSNTGVGPFFANINDLIPNTTYYIRAVSTSAGGTSYGNQLQITTGNVILPTVITDSIFYISATAAYGYGNEISNGNYPNTIAGFCFSTSPNPTIIDSIVNAYGHNSGSFNAYMTGLSPNTTYYARAYLTNIAGTSYGTQLQFTTRAATLQVPSTDSITNITATTAYAYSYASDGWDQNGAKSFLCYNTSPNPTITDSTVFNYTGYTGLGITIHGLKPNTVYYVRVYLTNIGGTAYGNQLQFTTGSASLPAVITDSINFITAIKAHGNGNVLDDGNDPDITVGFCFNTSPNPTIVGNIVKDHLYSYNQRSSFYENIDGLTPNSIYYVRAYATNVAGTTYGSQIQFTTSNCFAYYNTTYDTLQNTFTLAIDTTILNNVISYKWDFGDGTTSSSSTPTHVYTYNGIYKVSMKIYTSSGDSCEYSRTIGKDNYGYIYRSSGFTLNVIHAASFTAIPEVQIAETNYIIMPNPTISIVNVLFSQMVNNVSVRILNIAGQTIIEQNNLTGNKFSFDLSNQASGLYILEVNENGIVTRNKLLKE